MQLFKDTNFDFLGLKWPFIGASLLLTLAGFASLAMKGGPAYGIDFKGGAEMRVRFQNEPSVDQIRKELGAKIKGEISVQPVLGEGGPELLIGTEITDEKALNADRDTIEQTLKGMFGAGSDKLDLNNTSTDDLANTLRGPLVPAGVTTEADLQKLVVGIKDYRISKGGIIKSVDELSGVAGATPAVREVIKSNTALGPFAILSTDVVGPKIGAELQQKAILATLYALAGMLVYIAFRFEWIYGVAAVIAVFHDTLITIGLFSLTNKEISLTVVAALLTLVGYSMNDTIVVFDRIRENMRLGRRDSMTNIINLSVNQTLSRTILTSGLTFLTAMALWLFGGQVLAGFSFALVVGIIVGTYSSIFIASPILVFWQDFMASRKPAGAAPMTPKQTAGGAAIGSKKAGRG
ncbi:MAG: protein translocase subunit SecF [Acidobacteriota bacterium]